MNIRPATLDDVPAIVAMAHRFARESRYATEFVQSLDVERAQNFAKSVVESEHGVIFLAENSVGPVGFIALLKYLSPIVGEVVVQELIWWVNPESRGTTGLRLLNAAERWTKEQGVSIIQMGAPDQNTAELYKRKGYKAMEMLYQRRLV